MVSVHNGHRKRVKAKFVEQGFKGMHQHEMLEFLLYYSIPQGDTNPIAHNLINRFGDIVGVFDAPYHELIKVKGVGAHTATLIKAMPALFREYAQCSQKLNILDSTTAAGEYFLPKFIGRTEETFFMVMLDNKSHVIRDVLLSEGSVNQVSINIRKIVELCLKYQASTVILAHNHPNGLAIPSIVDITTTKRIQSALELVGIQMYDHILVANGDYVSFADSGEL